MLELLKVKSKFVGGNAIMALSISEVVNQTGLSAHTLRYYERIGLLSVPRDANGIRHYNDDNLVRVKAITHYRRAGISLKNIAMLFSGADDELFLEVLLSSKEHLQQEQAELKATMDYLDYKIKLHQQRLAEKIGSADTCIPK